MRDHSSLRLLRSGVVTSCMLSLAIGAHMVGGGILPSLPVLIGLGVLALMPVAFLARRRLSLPVLVGLLAGGQVILHHAFEMLSRVPSCAPGAAYSGGLDHAGVAARCSPETAAATSAGMSTGMGSEHFLPHFVDSGTAPIMVLGHLVAVVVMAGMIAQGENAFVLLVAWLKPLAILPEPVRAVVYPSLPGYAERPVAPPARRNLPVDARRGPPSGLLRIVAAC